MFLNPIMLAGIGGAAVPLVLHLLSRARYRSVDWGAMMFLFGSDARQQRSARLRQWLLLLMRMALVALLAIALARPMVGNALASVGQEGASTTVILLDRSASMGFDANGRSRMDDGREIVRQILEGLHKGDEAALITLGDGGRGPVPQPTADLLSLASVVAGLKPSYGQANIADGLMRAADLLERSHRPNRQLFVVCDRQSLSWRQVNDAFRDAWQARMAKFTPPPAFYVIPVGGTESDNVAVDALSLVSPPAIVRQSAEIEVRVHNYGPTPRTALPLSVRAGERTFHTTLNIAAGASATAQFVTSFGQTGSHVMSASVEATGITSDDELDTAVDVVDPIPVLILSGDVHSGTYRDEADLLKLALAPFSAAGRQGADMAAVDVRTASAGETLDDAAQYRVIILANVPQLSSTLAQSLEQFIFGGGGLLVAPGNLTQVDNYNALLYRDGAGILPAELKHPTPADGTAATTLLGLDLSHPIFHFLKAAPNPSPLVTIARYFPSVPRPSDARVLATYASGEPFLLEAGAGRGRVLLVTTPLDAEWGSLPMSNFYLPLVQSAVRYLSAGVAADRNLRPGEAIVAPLDAPGGPRDVAVVTPAGDRLPAPVVRAGEQIEVHFNATTDPGIYRLVVQEPNQPSRRTDYVVQAPRWDSDLTPLTDARWQWLREALRFETIDSTHANVTAVMAGRRSARELWPMLLGGVFLIALGELALTRLWSRESV